MGNTKMLFKSIIRNYLVFVNRRWAGQLFIFGAVLLIINYWPQNLAIGDPNNEKLEPHIVLPEGTILGGPYGASNFNVSTDGKYICFFKKLGKNDQPGLFRGVGKYVIYYTQNGVSQKIERLIQDDSIFGLSSSSGDPEFSHSGEYVLIHAMPNIDANNFCGTSLLFIVNLKNRKVSKLTGNYLGPGKWAGNSIAISTNSDEEINNIKIIDPTDNKSRTLDVCGFVIEGDPGGRFILVRANPENLKDSIPWKTGTEKLHLLAINLQGKIIRDFGKEPALIEKAAISLHGKFAMYKANDGRGPYVRIFSINTQINRFIKKDETPLCITDKGIAATCKWELTEDDKGNGQKIMKMDFVINGWDTDNHSWRLLSGKPIINAVGVYDLLYYVEVTKNGRGLFYNKPLADLIVTRQQ
jgi:hypothetical protein